MIGKLAHCLLITVCCLLITTYRLLLYNLRMTLTIHPLSAIAARIDQPFSLISRGLVGDVGVHLYVAQGQLDWHKHIDED